MTLKNNRNPYIFLKQGLFKKDKTPLKKPLEKDKNPYMFLKKDL